MDGEPKRRSVTESRRQDGSRPCVSDIWDIERPAASWPRESEAGFLRRGSRPARPGLWAPLDALVARVRGRGAGGKPGRRGMTESRRLDGSRPYVSDIWDIERPAASWPEPARG